MTTHAFLGIAALVILLGIVLLITEYLSAVIRYYLLRGFAKILPRFFEAPLTKAEELIQLRQELQSASNLADHWHRERNQLAAALKEQRARASSDDGGEKFQFAKRTFARLYHPDQSRFEGIERTIRTEMFKEFWSELEKIEKAA